MRALVKNRFIFILSALIVFTGCNQDGTAKFEAMSTSEDRTPIPSPYSEKIEFDGITLLNNPHPTQASISWTDIEGAQLYQVFDVSSDEPLLITELTPPADNYAFSDLEEGQSYAFRVKAIDEDGKPDSNENDVSFTTAFCPDGYLRVGGNTTFGINDFCVMKYEAKNVDGIATSQPQELPWANIRRTTAHATCNALNDHVGVIEKYDLISNPEWMTIAREIENSEANWSNSNVGDGAINRGRIATSRLPVDDPSDPYSNSAVTWDQKRTHSLSSGEEIWDLSGNVWEAVDWIPGGGLDNAPSGCSGSTFVPVNTANCGALLPIDYQSADPSYNNSQTIGEYFADGNTNPYRGGGYTYGTASGIYALGLAYGTTWSEPYVGFRCVYRP